MSYNVTNWNVKRIENLVIPVDSLFKCERTDWHPKRQDYDDGTIIFRLGECEIVGIIEGKNLLVNDIDWFGECSGTGMNLVLEPALIDSKGILEVIIVWEGGDSIQRLTVIDGEVELEEIEL